jgi:hypothetical protein
MDNLDSPNSRQQEAGNSRWGHQPEVCLYTGRAAPLAPPDVALNPPHPCLATLMWHLLLRTLCQQFLLYPSPSFQPLDIILTLSFPFCLSCILVFLPHHLFIHMSDLGLTSWDTGNSEPRKTHTWPTGSLPISPWRPPSSTKLSQTGWQIEGCFANTPKGHCSSLEAICMRYFYLLFKIVLLLCCYNNIADILKSIVKAHTILPVFPDCGSPVTICIAF